MIFLGREGYMKNFRIAVVLFLGVGLLGIAAQKKAPTLPKVEKKEVVVPGNQAWMNSGLRIRPTDRVTLSASGQVWFNADEESCVGPNGYQAEHGIYSEAWPNDYLECDDPLPGENHAALIVDLGSETFFAGQSIGFTGKEGFLYLGINDCSFTGKCPNRGEFTVMIKIERKR
jgi:hypothetical protein